MSEVKLDEVYFFLLERTVRQLRRFNQRELSNKGIDISGEQWVILKRAHESPGLSQKEIAESTYKDPASVTRMLDLLEKRGLLKRMADEGDRRSSSIYTTEEGNNFVESVLPLAAEMRAFGLRSISKEDQKIFMEVLNKIYFNLE
ncbi:MAG: MarR family transcriptional regulator [Vicingaceae bacterium]